MKDDIFVIRELDKYSSMTDIIRSNKYELENKILEQKIVEANYYISKQLNLPLASKLLYLKRVRIVEGKPKSLEQVYISLDEVKELEHMDLNNVSFYEVLSKYKHIKQLRSQEEIMIVEANEEEKKVLELSDKEILLIKGVTYKTNDRPLEYFEIATIPGFFRFRSVSKL